MVVAVLGASAGNTAEMPVNDFVEISGAARLHGLGQKANREGNPVS
jgi:hypothetical protein